MSRSEAESVAGSDEDAGSDDNVYLGDYDDPVTTTAQPPMTREEADAMAANFSLMAEIDNGERQVPSCDRILARSSLT